MMNEECTSIHRQEHHGLPPCFERHTVINAATCETVLDGVTGCEFDRWYDHHAYWRKVRSLEEVHPSLRAVYIERDDDRVHYLVQD